MMSRYQHYFLISREQFIRDTLNKGNLIIFPEENELQLDIDSEESYNTFLRLYETLNDFCTQHHGKGIIWDGHFSKSGPPKMHITVKLPFSVTPEQRCAFQACLVSDPVRELLSMIRILLNIDNPTLFKEIKE